MRLSAWLAMVLVGMSAGSAMADDPEISTLTKQVETGNPQQQTHAARVLGEIGPAASKAVPALIKALESSHTGLRYEAAVSLGLINGDPKTVVPALTKALGDELPLVQFAAVESLRKYGRRASEAAPKLKSLLISKEQLLAVGAAQAIAEIEGGKGPNSADAQAVLVDGLKSDQMEVSAHAILGLAMIGAPAVPAIQSLMNSGDAHCCTNCCDALAAMGPAAEKAVGALTERAKSGEPVVRWHAISCLGNIGPAAQASVPLLVVSLNDPDSQIKVAAEQSLVKIGKPAVPALIDGLKDEAIRGPVATVIAMIGPDASAAIPALSDMLQSKDTETRREAILALAAIGKEASSTAPALTKILDDATAESRPAAAYALGKMVAKSATASLKKAMDEKSNPTLQLAAVWALLQIEPTNNEYATIAMPQLTAALENERPQIRREAARTLGSLGAKARTSVPALQKHLQDMDPTVRRETLVALAEIGAESPSLVTDLLQVINEGDPSSGSIACYALGRLGASAKAAVPVLKRMLSSRDPHERMVAAWALVQISPEPENVNAAIPLLVSALGRDQSPEARIEAAKALGKVGGKSQLAKDALKSAANDGNDAVKKAAEQALKQLQ